MGYNNIGNYYVNRSRNTTIIKNTTIINNYGTEGNRRYSMGPNSNDVQRYTGRSVQPLRVSNASDSRSAGVSNDEMRVYRPVTRPARTTGTTTAPNNNRTTTPQARTQPEQQPATRTVPQTRTQPEQQPQTRTAPQARMQQEQSAVREAAPTQEYRPNPAQPAVTRRSNPQSTRQIQHAEKDNQRTQQSSGRNSRER
jgi:hypothetical protein